MRSPNIVSEVGLPTRVSQWWEAVPFITSVVVIVCGAIYLVCLLLGYDSFLEICFLPRALISHFQVYRVYTSILFHGSLLHVLFNMLAFVPLGSALERIMGSLRLLHLILLLATSNAIFHLIIAFLVAHNPFHLSESLMNECGIGFSGVIFSMIVIETALSGVQSRSVFGLFNVPAQWYAWILLIVFQLIMTNVSLLGHLCGILSGFAYTYGMFNFLLVGSSFCSSIEGSSLLLACVRRPRYIVCSGGNPSSELPTHSNASTLSRSLSAGETWRNLLSWMPRRGSTDQPAEDSQRFPGRGRTLGSSRTQATTEADLSLQVRLLDDNLSNERHVALDDSTTSPVLMATSENPSSFDEEVKKLVAIGFDKIQAEVALAAADGDSNVAIEILMTQKVYTNFYKRINLAGVDGGGKEFIFREVIRASEALLKITLGKRANVKVTLIPDILYY